MKPPRHLPGIEASTLPRHLPGIKASTRPRRPRSEFRLRSPTEVGIPTSLSHRGRKSDFAPSFRQSCADNRIAPFNPALTTGLPPSILCVAQDCPRQSYVGSRIAPVQHQQLGLGTVLARAQARDGVGPAVEVPGLRHVVDARNEGQAARKVRLAVPSGRPGRGPPPSCHSSSWCDRGRCRRVSVDAGLLGRRAGQCPQVGQCVLAPHGHIRRWLLQPTHAAQGQWLLLPCERPHFPKKLL